MEKKQNEKLHTLLSNMGVNNPEEVLKDPESSGKEINKRLSQGEHAISTLRDMQNRNPEKEIRGMGLSPELAAKHYDTVTEFSCAPPNFVCAESMYEQSFMLYDRSKISLGAGDEVCMTSGMYAQQVKANPTIKPAKRTFKDLYNPYSGQKLDGKTLFVWRSGGIGDLLFIRPILLAFKEKYDVTIIFATKQQYHSMVEQWDDCIDHLHKVPFMTDDTLAAADYHITFEGLIERCKDAERMDVHDLFAKRACIEVADYNRPMKCIVQNSFFDLLRGDYAVVQIRASAPTRTPLHGKFVEIVNHLTKSIDVVISGSAHTSTEIQNFISCCDNPERITNFAYFTGSVVDAVKLVTDAKIVVAPDSSHVHMAAAQGVPCVGLYGPFPARVRAEHYKRFIGVEPDESDCCTYGGKECFLHAHIPCKYKMKCWNNLDPQKVINAIEELTK